MESKIKIWKRIAQIAASFSFVIALLLIVNYAQYKRIDPIETSILNSLIEKLNNNPEDKLLIEEIRTIDLLSRKAYFTSQWQIRIGGYLLLISIAIIVIATQKIQTYSKKKILLSENEDSIINQKNARFWVSISGISIVLIALITAYLSHNSLSENFETAIQNAKITKESEDEIITSEITKDTISKEKTNILENVEVDIAENKKEIIKEEITQNNITPQTESENVSDKNTNETANDFPTNNEIRNNHPSFRGPFGNGISYSKSPPTNWNIEQNENLLWKIKIPLHGYNSPVIWGNKIFLTGATSSKREVYCIDKNTGTILWTYDVKDIPGSPQVAPKVTDDTGQAAPSVTTDGKRVYAIFANGDIITINFNGEKAWAKNLGSTGNHYGHSSSLMLYQNILVLQYDTKANPKIMGLSTATGKTLWETPRKVKVSWASPVVINTGKETEILIASDPFISSYNPNTGVENWKINCIFGEVGPSVCFANGIVFAVNEYAKLVAIKISETPEILWESNEYLSDVPSPVATNDLLFMATSYGVVVCYNTKNGEKYWEHEFENGFYSSPILVDKKIYLMDVKGTVHIFGAEKNFVSIGESSIREKGMTTPAFTDGRIYIRGNEHLFCFGK